MWCVARCGRVAVSFGVSGLRGGWLLGRGCGGSSGGGTVGPFSIKAHTIEPNAVRVRLPTVAAAAAAAAQPAIVIISGNIVAAAAAACAGAAAHGLVLIAAGVHALCFTVSFPVPAMRCGAVACTPLLLYTSHCGGEPSVAGLGSQASQGCEQRYHLRGMQDVKSQ